MIDKAYNDNPIIDRIIKVLFAGMCLYSVLSWLNLLILTPDSANYISAAQNLLKSGDMLVNVNWPSWSYELGTEIFSEYPPGFPLMISVFLFLFNDPTVAIAVLQSMAISLIYFAVYKLAKGLKFSWVVTLMIGIILTVFPTFRVIYAHFWTETIFIAVLIMSLYISLQLLKLSNRNLWPTLFFLLFFASGIKYVGVFNLALLIPVFWVYREKGERLINFLLAVLCSVLPIGIWFLRNIASFGSISRSHFADIVPSELTHEVSFVMFFIALLLAVIFIVIVIIPLLSKKLIDKKPIQIFAAYLLTFASGLLVLSQVTSIDPPGHRLLAPFIIIALITLMYALKLISDKIFTNRFLKIFQIIVPVVLIVGSLWIYKYPEVPTAISINRPDEEMLWSGIKEQKFYSISSHFYSGYNFAHQIYSDKLQRIIWADAYDDTTFQQLLPNIGDSPFFVVDLKKDKKEYLDLIQSYEESGIKFKVYLNPKMPRFLVLYPNPEK